MKRLLAVAATVPVLLGVCATPSSAAVVKSAECTSLIYTATMRAAGSFDVAEASSTHWNNYAGRYRVGVHNGDSYLHNLYNQVTTSVYDYSRNTTVISRISPKVKADGALRYYSAGNALSRKGQSRIRIRGYFGVGSTVGRYCDGLSYTY